MEKIKQNVSCVTRKKACKAVFNKRITDTFSLLLKGFSSREVEKKIMHDWKIGFRQACNYVKLARQILVEMNIENQKEFIILCKYRLEELFQKAMEKNDLDLARKIIISEFQILGLKDFKFDETNIKLNEILTCFEKIGLKN